MIPRINTFKHKFLDYIHHFPELEKQCRIIISFNIADLFSLSLGLIEKIRIPLYSLCPS